MPPRKTKKPDPVEAVTQVMDEIARDDGSKEPESEIVVHPDMSTAKVSGEFVNDIRERLINLSTGLLSPWEKQFVKDVRAAVKVDMTPKKLSIATQILRRYCD